MRIFHCLIILFFLFSGFLFPDDILAGRVPSPTEFSGFKTDQKPGAYQEQSFAKLVSGSFPTVDSLNVLVIRVRFPDRDFSDGRGQVYYENELRHMREYFTGASAGRFVLECDLVSGIIDLPFEEAYYGDNDPWDLRMAEIMMTVVDSLDELYDFSGWDAFAILHAGQGKETDFNRDSQEQIWSGFIDPDEMAELLADTLGTPGIPTGDAMGEEMFFIDNIMVFPENATQDEIVFGSLGIYVYQVGMRIGMIPLFDSTPSGFPDSQGIGAFGLMSYGLYNAMGFVPGFPCAFHRYLMGWVDAVTLTEDTSVRITDINNHSSSDTALVRIPAGPSEYFLIANRLHDVDQDRRFDFTDINSNGIPENEDILLGAEFDFYVTGTTDPAEYIDGTKYTSTGSGLKIWHIDERIIADRLFSNGYVNDDPLLKGVDLEEADGVQDMDIRGGLYAFGSYHDSFREGVNERFAADTRPSSSYNSGILSGIIIEAVSAVSHVMTFDLSFSPVSEKVSASLDGDVSGMSPVVADLEGDGSQELLIVANDVEGGKIFIIRDADASVWEGMVGVFAVCDSVAWTGPPVVADIDGDGSREVIITSTGGTVHAFTSDGLPFTIDTDDSPGTLDLRGGIVTIPLVLKDPGDVADEVLVLSSDEDSTFIYMIGADGVEWDGKFITPGVVAVRNLVEGRPVSHPARGVMGKWLDSEAEGFFLATVFDGEVNLNYFSLSNIYGIVSAGVNGADDPGILLMPSVGDIDRDDCDEMVIGIPGTGLVYFDPFTDSPSIYTPDPRIFVSSAAGNNPSACAISDLDGDGVLETIVRDSENMYLLKGFGTGLPSWPVKIPAAMVGLEKGCIPAQPLTADLDGDGYLEILFNTAGELYSLEIAGTVTRGWPLKGEGDGTVSAAFVRDQDDNLFVFSTGTLKSLVHPDPSGIVINRSVSIVSRYDLRLVDAAEGGWSMFRHDAGGTGRQEAPVQSVTPLSFVREETFICYPNPVTTDVITVRVEISGRADVTIRVLNLEGEEVIISRTSHDWPEGSVPFELTIPVHGVSSGIYICHMEVSGEGRKWSGARKFAVIR